MDSEGNVIHLKLETLKGSLSVNGSGQMNLGDKQYTFTGSMAPVTRAAELESALRLLGNDVGDGKRTFILNGRAAF